MKMRAIVSRRESGRWESGVEVVRREIREGQRAGRVLKEEKVERWV